MLERINQELKRRTLVVRIFPNSASCLRLIRAHTASLACGEVLSVPNFTYGWGLINVLKASQSKWRGGSSGTSVPTVPPKPQKTDSLPQWPPKRRSS